MAYAAPPVKAYPPPPLREQPSQFGAPPGPDTLAIAMSGMTISSEQVAISSHQFTSSPSYTLAYQPISYQSETVPVAHIQSSQSNTQHREPDQRIQAPFSKMQPPPLPAAITRPTYQPQSPAAPQTVQSQYSPVAHRPASAPYNPHTASQQPTFPLPPGYGGTQPALVQYAGPSLPQCHQGQRPISTHLYQHVPQLVGPSYPGAPPVYSVQSQDDRSSLQISEYPKQRPYPYNHQQTPNRPISYAGTHQLSAPAHPQARPQQAEKKNRGLLSSTGKLGAGLVGGLATAMLAPQGKDKLEKWGKGKMNSFAGTLGYAPSTPSPAAGRPSHAQPHRPLGVQGVQGPRQVSYSESGVPARRPVGFTSPGGGRGAVGHPVATAMLAGAVAGGVGGVVGASLARNSDDHYRPLHNTAIAAGQGTVCDDTTIVETSYVDASSIDASASTNNVGFDSTVVFDQTTVVDTSYSGGVGDTNTTYSAAYGDYQGTGLWETSTIYTDTSGSMYTGTSSYGQTDAYSGSAYAEPSYAADTAYTGYEGDTSYIGETEALADAGGVGEAASSAASGGSWLDSLGLGSSSWTDMSSWGGDSLDGGAAALALI